MRFHIWNVFIFIKSLILHFFFSKKVIQLLFAPHHFNYNLVVIKTLIGKRHFGLVLSNEEVSSAARPEDR